MSVQTKQCCLCGGTEPPPDEKFWNVVKWGRWAHPVCFRKVMSEIRNIPHDELMKAIADDETRNGWTHTLVQPAAQEGDRGG